MRSILVSLIGSVLLGLAFAAEAETGQAGDACRSLDRPNIDCTCVDRRVQTFAQVAPDDTARSLITQGYLYSLGQDNRYEQTLEASMRDPMSMITAEQAFDALGARPENIDDYESACVIAGADLPTLPPAPDWPSVEDYVQQCTATTGDQRGCQCTAAQAASHLNEREFEAYYRSFSDYSDTDATTLADLSRSRGAAMGLSGDAFDRLQAQAREKLAPHETSDTQYCAALTAADQSEGFSDAERQQAGVGDGAAAFLAPTTASAQSDPALTGMAQTRDIVRQSCVVDGNSRPYCQCYMDEFETRVVAASPSENITRAWVLMNAASSLEPTVYAQMVQALPQSDHQAAAILMMQSMDIGTHCSQGPVSTDPDLPGPARERMLHICVAENQDETVCKCTVDQMQSNLSEDDFELIVDIREAEFKGAEDPLAAVAAERGLTGTEAEQALVMNASMITGIMSMNLMTCFGGMPTMPVLPELAQQ